MGLRLGAIWGRGMGERRGNGREEVGVNGHGGKEGNGVIEEKDI